MSYPHVDNGCFHPVNDIVEYGSVLLKFGITYTHRDPWLEVGNCIATHNWLLYISALSQYTERVIYEVAPLLHAYHVPFKLLQNSKAVDSSNGLGWGTKDAGKIMIVYPSSVKQAMLLANELELVTKKYEGILIENCVRVGKLVYAEHPQMPAAKVPFHIPKAYRIKRRKGRIGRYYVPIRLLQFSPKGDISLGVNLKGFSFTPCIIKQARAGSYVDKAARSSFHKLQWQKTVLEALQDKLPVPRVIDFCRKGNDYYLITDYIEGESLARTVIQRHENLPWNALSAAAKRELLSYFLQITEIIRALHQLGYLHRDIQINNFIIRNGKVHIIDFELAYNMPAGTPYPAFGFGTTGFVSPQQGIAAIPTPGEDIFSLGAVLAYIILNPRTMQEFSGNLYDSLVNVETESFLLDIIVKCMEPASEQRISLDDMITALKSGKINPSNAI